MRRPIGIPPVMERVNRARIWTGLLAMVGGLLSCAPPSSGPLADRSVRPRAVRQRDDNRPAIPPGAWPPGRETAVEPAEEGGEAGDTALPNDLYAKLTEGNVALGPDPELGRRVSKPDPPANLDAMARQLIEAHNRVRQDVGLPPLQASAMLMTAAQAHAEDMARHDKMDHQGTDGSQATERIRREGYAAAGSGENVAAGFRSVDQAVAGWMTSKGHRANILGHFNEIGVGLARGAKGMPYWCVVFGRRFFVMDPDEAAAAVIDRINKARAEQGLALFQAHPILQGVARRHAYAMARRGRLVAIDEIGMNPLERAGRLGYAFRDSGLSMGSGQDDCDALVRGWIADRKARRFVLGEFRDVGVGNAADREGTPYWSLIVGTTAGP